MHTGSERARAGAQWLELREPADAQARSRELVAEVMPLLPAHGKVIHDLGSGTGSMCRWLAPQLDGPQHWVLHDRDTDLLASAQQPAGRAADGAPITVETRCGDVTRLDPAAITGAGLVTASALLDVLTAEELVRLVDTCAVAACPVLMTLTVTGHVELTPADPIDGHVAEAFNAHQQRRVGGEGLLGPRALQAAIDVFSERGLATQVHPSAWHLGPDRAALAEAWLSGWLSAAFDQQPELADRIGTYADRRLAEAAEGRLGITVHHQDLLVLPG